MCILKKHEVPVLWLLALIKDPASSSYVPNSYVHQSVPGSQTGVGGVVGVSHTTNIGGTASSAADLSSIVKAVRDHNEDLLRSLSSNSNSDSDFLLGLVTVQDKGDVESSQEVLENALAIMPSKFLGIVSSAFEVTVAAATKVTQEAASKAAAARKEEADAAAAAAAAAASSSASNGTSSTSVWEELESGYTRTCFFFIHNYMHFLKHYT